MKAKCINANGHPSLTMGKWYLIFAGEGVIINDELKKVLKIRIQNDSGSVVIYDAIIFHIETTQLNCYTFSQKRIGEFAVSCISYDGFWEMFYEDRPSERDNYFVAQRDFITAKKNIYTEYSFEELKEKMLNESVDERDFVFNFLIDNKDDRFIQIALGIIEEKKNSFNVKYFEVEEIFKYLATFKNDVVYNFFTEYISDDVWESDEINKIIYGYFE